MDESLKSARRIYYAVLAVSAALVVVALGPRRSERYERAQRELDSLWNAGLPRAYVEVASYTPGDLRGSLLDSLLKPKELVDLVGSFRDTLGLDVRGVAGALYLVGIWQLHDRPLELPDSTRNSSLVELRRLLTRRFVDTMHVPRRVISVRRRSIGAAATWPPATDDSLLSSELRRCLEFRDAAEPLEDCLQNGYMPLRQRRQGTTLEVLQLTRRGGDTVLFAVTFSTRPVVVYSYLYVNPFRPLFGATMVPKDEVGRLSAAPGSTWMPKASTWGSDRVRRFPFAFTWTDLVWEEIKDRNLREAVEYLANRAIELQQHAAFLGLALSERLSGIGGPMLLVLVLSYLFVYVGHVERLVRSRREDLRSEDLRTFPWAVLFPGPAGKLSAVIGLVVIPLAATAMIGLRYADLDIYWSGSLAQYPHIASRHLGGPWARPVLAPALLTVTVGAMSMVLCARLFRLREAAHLNSEPRDAPHNELRTPGPPPPITPMPDASVPNQEGGDDVSAPRPRSPHADGNC